MKKLLLTMAFALSIACNSNSDEPTDEEKATACLAAVLICQQDPEEGGQRNFCLSTFASRICVGVYL